MTKETIIALLKTVRIRKIFARSGISHIRLFGSYAQNKANKQSDIDLLYIFDAKKDKSLGGIFSIYGHLADDISQPIDLVNHDSLSPQFRKQIFSSLIKVF